MSVSDSQIYVNYSQCGDVHQALEEATSQIQNVLHNLEDAIQPLRATWTGASESTYEQIQARWNNDVSQMQTLLGNHGNTLADMTNNTSRTDNGLADQWASIAG